MPVTLSPVSFWIIYALWAMFGIAVLLTIRGALWAFRRRRDHNRVLRTQMSYDEYLRRYPRPNVNLD